MDMPAVGSLAVQGTDDVWRDRAAAHAQCGYAAGWYFNDRGEFPG